jgi:HD-like signal output (HDOD) protein
MAICAKILQLVNSSFFRRARSILRLEEAVNYLGINLIKQITLASEVFSSAENHPMIDGFSINELQRHALLTTAIASQIVTDKHQVNDSFLAGMLHDIGLLVFATGSPGQFAKTLAIARREKRPLYVVEQKLFGITHADVGGYLLGMWGLPYPLAEVAGYHHTPALISHDCMTVLPAVYVAQVLAHEVTADDFESQEELDLDYLAELGGVDQLESWREIAQQEFQKSNHE